jgi:SsrA-binding protein
MEHVNGTIAENRRARFDYEPLEKFEAGIVLDGFEVKSAKLGKLNLSGSYALIRGGEAFLFNASIQPFSGANVPPGYDSDRARKLLLTKEQIRELTGKLEEKRLSLIPFRAFVTRNLVKLDIALARSKRSEDKRETIKKRDTERDMRRAMQK